MEITKDMSELIGAIIGDGNIYKNRYIEISGNRLLDAHYFEKRLVPIIRKELDYEPHLASRANSITLRINKKVFASWLNEIGIPSGEGKCYKVTIPDIVLNSEENTNSCIRGIFDTDGFIYWDKRQIYKNPYPRLGITTCSKRLFNQLVEVLESLEFEGIYAKYNPHRRSNDIELYGHVNLYKWANIIGSSNKKNLDKIMPL